MNAASIEHFKMAVGEEQFLPDEPMKNHTTFRAGGPADLLVMPRSEEALCSCIRIAEEEHIPWYLIGNGSNLLVGDGGIRGVVIKSDRSFGEITVDGNYLYAQAGAMLSLIARSALNHALSGLEFASGIPGTLGGALAMNAGAYGGEMRDVVESVRVYDPAEDKILTLSKEEMDFSYRHSIITDRHLIALSARLRLDRAEAEEISRRMEELRVQRTSKQPLDKPSAGSTFKRPEGFFAGKLIMDAGLAGCRIGGACVSEKHCGFIVNDAGASAQDILSLIRHVQARVQEQFGVMLEPEVKMLGEFTDL